MQNEKKPEKRYRELIQQKSPLMDTGPSVEAMKQLYEEGYALYLKQASGRSLKLLLKDLSDPTLDKRSYKTLLEYILGMVKNKGPKSTSPLSTKIDFVKRSLNEKGISVSDEEIWTVLDEEPLVEDPFDEGADGRASSQAVLGIFLALAIHYFDYDPEKLKQPATMNIKRAAFPEELHMRKEDTILKWLKIAAAEVVRH